MQRPGGLADVSVPDVVREDALSLVLQHLHAAWLGQAARLRLEEHDGLHAAALGGVRRHVAEPETLLNVRQLSVSVEDLFCRNGQWPPNRPNMGPTSKREEQYGKDDTIK